MTRTKRPFPVALRLLATACALFLLATVAPIASADNPTKQDVIDARQREAELRADLADKRLELDAIEARLVESAFAVDQQEGLIEEVQVEILATQERIDQTHERYDRLRVQLNERAAEAYMEGPGSGLDLVLDATSFAELSDRMEFVDAVNASDAALAQEVANLNYQLEVDEAALQELKVREMGRLDRLSDIEAQIRDDLAAAEALRAELAADTAAAAKVTDQAIEDWEDYLAKISVSSHSNVPMPAGWEKVLAKCPVPNGAFGDGFGAPRYVGGYHPHRGVDVVATLGSPVYAGFDGVAYDSTNELGGTSVKVVGEYGYSYNAHMMVGRINLGPVSAGDIIGYVDSTGLAGGSTPHLHFEFWPNVIPSGWPVSYYGYSVIDGSINPYPLLVAACG